MWTERSSRWVARSTPSTRGCPAMTASRVPTRSSETTRAWWRPGTARSAETVREALGQLGIGPDDLATIVVTHIHLDHAGGVGDLARMFPRAEVVVHEAGARHLADPERLLASARRVFGSVLDDVFGVLAPTDAHRIRSLGATGVIDLGGGRTLEAFHAPGHASHHLGLVDSATGDLYVGDAAGIYVPETADVRPSTPPPDFDLELACASIERFRAVRARRACCSATSARSTRSRRRWTGRRRSYGCGSSWSAALGSTGSTSTTPSPACVNRPPSATPTSSPTRNASPATSTSTPTGPTWSASCAGSTAVDPLDAVVG